MLAFTRALGATDPPGGLGEATPPTFAIASAQFDPDYPLRPRPGAPWHGSGAGAGLVTEGASGLHAEQHFVYHRPVRVGDVLAGTSRPGQEWEKRGVPGGCGSASRLPSSATKRASSW